LSTLDSGVHASVVLVDALEVVQWREGEGIVGNTARVAVTVQLLALWGALMLDALCTAEGMDAERLMQTLALLVELNEGDD
jgi:hypothetical protein